MRQNHSLSIVFIMVVVALGTFVKDSQSYCTPQCVKWAREHSNVKIAVGENGTAKDLVAFAQKDPANYKLISTPKKKSIMVLNIGATGHVIAVQNVDKKNNGKYSLKITHANYDNQCHDESNIKATYNKKTNKIKFRSGYWDGKELGVIAIIKRK